MLAFARRFALRGPGRWGPALVSLLLLLLPPAESAAEPGDLPVCSEAQRMEWDFAWSETLGVTVVDPAFFIGHNPVWKKARSALGNALTADPRGNWYPVDGTKRTVCGDLDHWSLFIGMELRTDEYDLHPHIRPADPFRFVLSDSDPITEWRGGQATTCEGCLYGEITAPVVFRQWFYGEPTPPTKIRQARVMDQEGKKIPRNEYVTNRYLGSRVCAYGPWVFEDAHDDIREIHPLERFWAFDRPTGKLHLMVIQDASDRFQKKEYYRGVKAPGWRPWAEGPIQGEFRLAVKKPRSSARPLSLAVETLQAGALGKVPPKSPLAAGEFESKSYYAYNRNGFQVIVKRPPQVSARVDEGSLCTAGDEVRGFVRIALTVGSRGGEEGFAVLTLDRPDVDVLEGGPPSHDRRILEDCEAPLSSTQRTRCYAPFSAKAVPSERDLEPETREPREAPALRPGFAPSSVRPTDVLKAYPGWPGAKTLAAWGVDITDPIVQWWFVPGQFVDLDAFYESEGEALEEGAALDVPDRLKVNWKTRAWLEEGGSSRDLPVLIGQPATVDAAGFEHVCGRSLREIRYDGTPSPTACRGIRPKGAGTLAIHFPVGSPRSAVFEATAEIEGPDGTTKGTFTYRVQSVTPAKVAGLAPDPASGWPEGLAEQLVRAARKRTDAPLTLEKLLEDWQDPKVLPVPDLEAQRRARVLRFAGTRFFQDAFISPEELEVLLRLTLAYAAALRPRVASVGP